MGKPMSNSTCYKGYKILVKRVMKYGLADMGGEEKKELKVHK
jgi:hypothetical protein